MKSIFYFTITFLPGDWVKSFCWKPSLPCDRESDAVADFPTTELSRFVGNIGFVPLL